MKVGGRLAAFTGFGLLLATIVVFTAIHELGAPSSLAPPSASARLRSDGSPPPT